MKNKPEYTGHPVIHGNATFAKYSKADEFGVNRRAWVIDHAATASHVDVYDVSGAALATAAFFGPDRAALADAQLKVWLDMFDIRELPPVPRLAAWTKPSTGYWTRHSLNDDVEMNVIVESQANGSVYACAAEYGKAGTGLRISAQEADPKAVRDMVDLYLRSLGCELED